MIIIGEMRLKRWIIFIVLAATLLIGCSVIIFSKETEDIAIKQALTSKEAEDIAIRQAIVEGYSNPRLFTDFDTTTQERSIYSKKHQKDVLAWEGCTCDG